MKFKSRRNSCSCYSSLSNYKAHFLFLVILQRIVNFKDNKLSNRKKLGHFVADFLASFKEKFDKKANTSAMTIVFKTINHT